MKDGGGYKFFLDISGTLHSEEDLVIGCVLLNERYQAAFREDFYRAFPTLRSFNSKGSGLKHDTLKAIIKFMDEKRVKMVAMKVPRYIIKKSEREVKEMIKTARNKQGDVSIPHFREKFVAIPYYHTLSVNAFQGCHYDVFSCLESQFDIHATFGVIRSLAAVDGKNHFRMSTLSRRNEHALKFADFIASAAKKLDDFQLAQFKSFTLLTCKPSSTELDRAFSVSRREVAVPQKNGQLPLLRRWENT